MNLRRLSRVNWRAERKYADRRLGLKLIVINESIFPLSFRSAYKYEIFPNDSMLFSVGGVFIKNFLKFLCRFFCVYKYILNYVDK